MSAKYYVAVVVYESASESPDYTPLYEECISLIKASSEDEARSKAEALGRTRSAKYKNVEGQEISWSLRNIVDINPMLEDSLGEVTEIYARHFKDIDAYRKFEALAKEGGDCQ
ncbi:MAG: hypothetical protein CSA66_05090 [Proteobacteria bacterium]|nr:MAG: hypothetical protein CSA66_05090 [Pseudomonadota bacterium]